jgi:Rps23 Pro-64 3,4-dihydroxylase Tpa1-like proline 4-hydroxylase
MWLNDEKISDSAICAYRSSLLSSCPKHVVIDQLFNSGTLDTIVTALQNSQHWQTQKHTYSALYVDNRQWENTREDQRFVKRDAWQRKQAFDTETDQAASTLADFLSFLRADQFMTLLSRIFNVTITDIHVADPEINTNYFRLSASDFVEQHADDSPGREICMLLYLNKHWQKDAGGELEFAGEHEKPISIAPRYNRCVLFDPSSKGSEHWVKRLNANYSDQYRYNVTSWYWSE